MYPSFARFPSLGLRFDLMHVFYGVCMINTVRHSQWQLQLGSMKLAHFQKKHHINSRKDTTYNTETVTVS